MSRYQGYGSSPGNFVDPAGLSRGLPGNMGVPMPGLTPPPGGWGDGGITLLPAKPGVAGKDVLILFGDEDEHASRRLAKRPVHAVSVSLPPPPGAVLPPSGGSWFGDWSEGWLDIAWYGFGGGGAGAAGEIWWAINEGRLQGTLNAINGLQHAVIGILNMSPNVLLTGYQIPSPEWAEGAVFQEDPLAHDVSVILGGEGLLTVLTAGLGVIGKARHLRPVTASATAARTPAAIGRAAEDAVSGLLGIPRNAGAGRATVPGTGPGGFRVPDFDPALTIATRGTVVEVKDVQRISMSPQLRDLEAFARSRNAPLEIFTNAPAPTRGELARLIARRRVILTPIP